MRFIQRSNCIISGVANILLAVFLCMYTITTVQANVCFLPDGEECNDGVTRGFWPGHRPDPDIEPERQSGNCDNFTDTTRRNECGQLCQVCSIAGDKNYGKYLCPSVPATGCAQACDCTLSEEAKNQKLASNPCMECEQCTSSECSEVNRGKWRCAINPKCQQCQASGYNKRYDSSEVTASNGTCSRTQCEPCSDKYNTLEAREWYKCYECDENTYTHNENNLTDDTVKEKHCDMAQKCGCYVGCDRCFGYDYRLNDCTSEGKEAINSCEGKGGTWYKECVCQGGVTEKKGEGQCWDYNDKCTDASGNKHFEQIENVRPGYKIEGGECVKEQECTYTYKELTYDEIISYAHGYRPRLWCGVRTNGGFTGGIELMNEIYKLGEYASLSQYSGVNSYMRYVDKISESSNSCIRDGVEYFETVCEGTPAHDCSKTYQIFTPKCKSRGYVITPDGNTDDCESTDSAPKLYDDEKSAVHIWSQEYGDCVKDCPKLGVSYYNSKNECENANSGKKCSQKDQCYRTCEALNKYSNDCGDNCEYEASSGCYVKNVFTITKGDDKKGCCKLNTYNRCLGWYVVLESTGRDTISIMQGSGEVPAGYYKICIVRQTDTPPQGSHYINISGWSIESTVNVELSYTGIQNSACTMDKVYLPARGSMVIKASDFTNTCTGTGSSGWIQ